jgi:LacI family transcriptional regulator
MSSPPTIRSLARRLRLSVATVSEALRNSPRVNEGTRARVQRLAEKTGYEANPLLGAALSAVRRGRHRHYRGTLALIDVVDANPAQYALFHHEIAMGAEKRAQELGFQTELFWLGPEAPALPLTRLPGMLHARGVPGAVLLPFNTAKDFSAFDFSRMAVVQMDHCLIQPHLHTILPDHYISMIHSLERLTERGYRRIGLCLETRKDDRIKGKWTAAFHAFFRMKAEACEVPALIAPQINEESFDAWFQRHRPDVVVGHVQDMVAWLENQGVKVPGEVGFFNLNLTERTGPCAGLDLAPRRLGAIAVESVVAMLHRQERGIPEYPQTVTLEAAWVDGPSLRAEHSVLLPSSARSAAAL